MASRNPAISPTRRIPRPPPATALTNTGNVIDSAAAINVSTSVEGSEDASTGSPAAFAAAIARALFPVSSNTCADGPTKVMSRPRARGGQVGVLRQEPVPRVDGIRAGRPGGVDDRLHRQVGADGVTGFPDLVGLVGLGAMHRVSVLHRIHRHGADPQLVGSTDA